MMTQSYERMDVGLIGFDQLHAKSFESIAERLHWTVMCFLGTNDCLSILCSSSPSLVFIDIEGIELFGPSFVGALKAANAELKVVCFGDGVFPALSEQFRLAGADLVMSKTAMSQSIEQFASSELTQAMLDVIGPKRFINFHLSKQRHLQHQQSLNEPRGW